VLANPYESMRYIKRACAEACTSNPLIIIERTSISNKPPQLSKMADVAAAPVEAPKPAKVVKAKAPKAAAKPKAPAQHPKFAEMIAG